MIATCSTRGGRRAAGSVVLFFVSLAGSAAHAECKRWDLSGQWLLQQNNGYGVSLTLRQSGTEITGTCTHNVQEKRERSLIPGENFIVPDTIHGGTVTGNLQGSDLYMRIEWGRATTGIYRGKVGANGRVEGSMYHQQVPSSKATWLIEKPVKCADELTTIPRTLVPGAGRPPQPNAAEVQKQQIRDAQTQAQKDAAAPPQPGPALKAPYIQANPPGPVPLSRGQLQGTATLMWDGGRRHPYAEVWVKVNGGDPTFVVEKGAGSRQVTVERGKTYTYILTDAGKQLAAVTLQTRP